MLSTLATMPSIIRFSAAVPSLNSHEIAGVSRGLGVYWGDRCIVGEGMGIGGPLALHDGRAIFPLDSEDLRAEKGSLVRRFHLNGLSDKYVGRGRADFPYRWIRTRLAPLYLKSERFRPIFYYLMAARTLAGVRSRYRRIRAVGRVDVNYRYEANRVRVDVDASSLRAEKYLVANELDGGVFRQLRIGESEIIRKIPPWLEIKHGEAKLEAPELGVSLRFKQLPGCRLFAGREVLGNRLNWTGFSYLPVRGLDRFSYDVVFEIND